MVEVPFVVSASYSVCDSIIIRASCTSCTEASGNFIFDTDIDLLVLLVTAGSITLPQPMLYTTVRIQ